nr:hypothetical protein [Tanacetum cinerariifolium]
SSTSLNSLLEETNTFDNSLPEFETFCFDVEEISSGSTTTHLDLSLSEYEAFYDDHVKEISSGSPTTPSDISLSEYDSFMFDLLINPFPPADRSDSYEFTDELIPFISAPEYDCFRFTVEPNSQDFTKDVVETISPMKEPQVLTILPTHPTLQLNMKFQPSSESLFAYVVWIFLPFLVYSVVPPYLLSLRTEDIIFDPGICKSTFSKPDISHQCRTVKKFITYRSHLNTFPIMSFDHTAEVPMMRLSLWYIDTVEVRPCWFSACQMLGTACQAGCQVLAIGMKTSPVGFSGVRTVRHTMYVTSWALFGLVQLLAHGLHWDVVSTRVPHSENGRLRLCHKASRRFPFSRREMRTLVPTPFEFDAPSVYKVHSFKHFASAKLHISMCLVPTGTSFIKSASTYPLMAF